ncbi:hypothetical protein [Roseibium algae]|uniref:Uncharacterized protein n=1 Tax=Roseibium algae TaxID=3123038 RepID=A0ABU8TKQ1_9HYPH
MNTAALTAILKDNELKKAFEKYINRQKIWKSYELATIHRDEITAIDIYYSKLSPADQSFAPNVWNKAQEIFNRIVHEEHMKALKIIEKKEGQKRELTVDEIKAYHLSARRSEKWKKFFKLSKVILNQTLSAHAEKEFPHTPEYAEYVRKKAKKEAEKLAKEHEMDREIDEWLGLSVAVATGDNKTATTISQRLSKKHQPKKGKAMKAADVAKAAKTRMKKLLHLS